MTACSKLRLPTSFQFVWTSFDLVEVIKLNFSVVKGDTENIEIKYASLETLISYLFCSTGSLDLHNIYITTTSTGVQHQLILLQKYS